MPTLPNPCRYRENRSLRPEEVDAVRRVDCAAYNGCLDVAIAHRWPAFTCIQCDAYQAAQADQQQRDLLGLCLLSAVLEERHELADRNLLAFVRLLFAPAVA